MQYEDILSRVPFPERAEALLREWGWEPGDELSIPAWDEILRRQRLPLTEMEAYKQNEAEEYKKLAGRFGDECSECGTLMEPVGRRLWFDADGNLVAVSHEECDGSLPPQ